MDTFKIDGVDVVADYGQLVTLAWAMGLKITSRLSFRTVAELLAAIDNGYDDREAFTMLLRDNGIGYCNV
jgi:hypothetical protein